MISHLHHSLSMCISSRETAPRCHASPIYPERMLESRLEEILACHWGWKHWYCSFGWRSIQVPDSTSALSRKYTVALASLYISHSASGQGLGFPIRIWEDDMGLKYTSWNWIGIPFLYNLVQNFHGGMTNVSRVLKILSQDHKSWYHVLIYHKSWVHGYEECSRDRNYWEWGFLSWF